MTNEVAKVAMDPTVYARNNEYPRKTFWVWNILVAEKSPSDDIALSLSCSHKLKILTKGRNIAIIHW